jgi:hypothetical protein
MIDAARQSARDARVLDRITFERGRIGDLDRYENGEFDLVICCDAPISYAYPDHIQAIAGLARVAARALVISVSSRLGYISYAFNPRQKEQYLADPASDAPEVKAYLAQTALSTYVPNLEAVRRRIRTQLVRHLIEPMIEWCVCPNRWSAPTLV